MATGFRPATPRERDRLARPLVAARVFADADELRRETDAAPWHLQVNERGDVAVLGRWRDHLPILGVDALWCPSHRIPDAMRGFLELARSEGLDDVVTPPVPIEDTQPYERAGMHLQTSVMTLARSTLPEDAAEAVGPRIREADHHDLGVLLATDAACFEPFWRYDARHIARFLLHGRLAVAEVGGEVVGYTLSTVDDDEALLGRLCVMPEWRRKGIAAALLRDALRYGRVHGARHTTLSTQVDNGPSQALYHQAGFRDTGRRYAFLRFGSAER